MKRKIIEIDEEKCTGCGHCIPDCPEGALQLIDGKARLVSDLFCDGLGACIHKCPFNAMHVVEREAEPYDEDKVMVNITRQGTNVIKAHLLHLKGHGEIELYKQAIRYLNRHHIPLPDLSEEASAFQGCAGSQVIDGREEKEKKSETGSVDSELQQWPVQLHLIPANASFLNGADLLITADCVPCSYGAFHQDFVKGRIMLLFCPKLDHSQEEYVEKLTSIFQEKQIRSITIVHMEVPCCSGVNWIIQQALEKAEKSIDLKSYTITIQGACIEDKGE